VGARAGLFRNENNLNGQPALEASSGGGPAFLARRTTGTGAIAEFFNASTSVAAIEPTGRGRFNGGILAQSNNGGVLLSMEHANTATTARLAELTNWGQANAFRLNQMNGNNTQPAMFLFSQNQGTSLHVQHAGTGNLALFQNGNTNVIRFTQAGVGIFAGGTQTTGADVAEAFEVEGNRSSYQPGDVLVISDALDRSVEKSAEPYSTRVVGVYATKPGLLLTDRAIDTNLDDTVPLGVIGVIPTKVTGEGGPIKRGDLLVSSSTQGHAMKGNDPTRMLGAVIGKALQEFDGKGSAMILVLVNVR
ncbi:MAG: beta strand repeat-containing protein, partial [Longimicrobiales bacterium]